MDKRAGSSDKKDSKTQFGLLVGLGVTITACSLLFIAAFIWFRPDKLSLSDRYFPSPTATSTATSTPTPTLTPTPTITPTSTITPTRTITPTPHALIPPPKGAVLLYEPFDSNNRNWGPFYNNNTVSIRDGKLHLMSNDVGYVGLVVCRGCARLGNIFYFQAEMLTTTTTSPPGGLAFCILNTDEYYVFQLLAGTREYFILKHTSSGWQDMVTNTYSKEINTYPDTNILGVIFDKGNMKLYINGTLVNSVNDPNPLTGGSIGIFINDGGVDLIADNAFLYQTEATPEPTP
jgi:hypothetical protein